MWKKAENFLLKDKYIGPLVKKYGPCKIRPAKKEKYFTDLADAIVQQQLSIKAARTIYQRVEDGLGKVTPKKIKKVNTEKLRSFGLSYSKSGYLKDLADKVLNDELHLDTLDELADEEVMKELIAVKGIGRWTAEMFLMFSLARPDVFPVDDLGIKKGIDILFERDVPSEKLGKIGKRWKPWRTPASWYIWRILD